MEAPMFFSLKKAARLLGIGEHTVRAAAKAGHLKTIKVGRLDKTTTEAVIQFAKAVESGEVQLRAA